MTNAESTDSLTFDFGPTRQKSADPYVEREYVKERLALAYRVIAHEQLCEGASGHLTSRDPVDRECFWVNPYGLHFSRMTASDLLLVNHQGKIIGGGKPDRQRYNAAAFVIHSAIHAARPDVDSAVHVHSPWGKAFSTLCRNLPFYTQDSATFYDDIALYANHGGVVLDSQESEEIVNSLGGKKALIMQNHGILTVGGSIEAAVAWFYLWVKGAETFMGYAEYRLEKECACVMRAEAAAAMTGQAPKVIDDEVAKFSWAHTGSQEAGHFEGTPFFDLVEELCNAAHKV